MIPTQQIMTLIKACERIFEYNSYWSLDVNNVNQILSWKHATSNKILQFWAITSVKWTYFFGFMQIIQNTTTGKQNYHKTFNVKLFEKNGPLTRC